MSLIMYSVVLQRHNFILNKFKGPAKSFGYWGLKLLPGIRVIAEGLAQRPRPEPPTSLDLHLFSALFLPVQKVTKTAS